MSKNLPSSSEARRQLELLRKSSCFRRSTRLFQLLDYLVTETLEGRGTSLKEIIVGDAVYARDTPYDPCVDSTVRVEARRLRSKLAEYYDGEGRDAPLRIELPKQGYQPNFAMNDSVRACAPFSDATDISCDIAVIPFHTISALASDYLLAEGIFDELVAELCRLSNLRIASRLQVASLSRADILSGSRKVPIAARTMLFGSLRGLGASIRLTLELSDARGIILWSAGLSSMRGNDDESASKLVCDALARMPEWALTARRPTPALRPIAS